MARRIGDNAVDRAQVLLDVHRDPPPRVRIARIRAESNRRRDVFAQAGRNDADGCAGRHRDPGHIAQAGVIPSDDEHPPGEVGIRHVHSLQFRR